LGLKETGLGYEGDKTKLGEFTCLFQTIHALIDAEDDVAFSGSACTDERVEG
jgi:hypothetical protein